MLIFGLATLIFAADLLVRGAVGIAVKLKVSSLVIGMTIVALGTSAPELLVSIKSVLSGHPDVSIGTVVGSNIANISLILGITAIMLPIKINKNSLRIDWPVMMFSTILFYFFIRNGFLNSWQGIIFTAILFTFNFILIYNSRKKGKAQLAEIEGEIDIETTKKQSIVKNIIFLILGAIGLYFGSSWLINGVVQIAKDFNVSEKFISISIVAFGTSVPELVTSIVAALKKETDISVGNLIGSNIFNILAILGITSIIQPISISQSILNFDIYALLAISFILFPIMLIGKKIGILKGVLLISIYSAYIYFALISEVSI